MIISAEPATERLQDKGLPVSVSPLQNIGHCCRVEGDGTGGAEDFRIRWKLLLNDMGMLPKVSSGGPQTKKKSEPSREPEGQSGVEVPGSGTDIESALGVSEPIDLNTGERQGNLTASDVGKLQRRSGMTPRHRTAAFAAAVGKLGTSGRRHPHVSDAKHLGTSKGNLPAVHADPVLEQRERIEGLTALNSAQGRPISIDGPRQGQPAAEGFVAAAFGSERGQEVDADRGRSRTSGTEIVRQIGPSRRPSFYIAPEQIATDVQTATEPTVPATTATKTAAPAGKCLERPENVERSAQTATNELAFENTALSSADSVANLVEAQEADHSSRPGGEHAVTERNAASSHVGPVSLLSTQLSSGPLTSGAHQSARGRSNDLSRDRSLVRSEGTLSTPSSPVLVNQVDPVLNSSRNSLPISELSTAGNLHPSAAVEFRGTQRNTIEALDGFPNTVEPRWTRSNAHRAEAGFQDPSLGWVSVRAEMSSGGVHASVIPPSNDAAQVLNGHLGGLDAHLANSHLHMHPVTISATQESQPGSAHGDGNQREYGGSANHNNHQSSSDNRRPTHGAKSYEQASIRSDDQGTQELRMLPANHLTSGGMYISLLA
jgi:hypothetical protein